MISPEQRSGSRSGKAEFEQTENGWEIRGSTYQLRFDDERPYVELTDRTREKWSELSLGSSLHTVEASDATLAHQPCRYEMDEDVVVVRQVVDSSAWQTKQHVWRCGAEFIELYDEVIGEDERTLTDIHLLGGEYTCIDRSGFFPSKSGFSSLFNPQPDILECRMIASTESTLITTNGMWEAGRAREFNVPTAWSFGVSKAVPTKRDVPSDGQYLMVGVAAPIDQQNFTECAYNSRGDGWSLALHYERQTKIRGAFRTPSVLLHFATDPYEGLVDHARFSREVGQLENHESPARVPWHERPIFSGWGEQDEMARLSTREANTQVVRAADLATEVFYDQALSTLEDHGVWPATVIVDDKWQQRYGTNTPDTDKWPDMKSWIHRQHEVGRKVLLWMRMWSPEGLPTELCIRDAAGRPVTSDPTNPEFLEACEAQLSYLLSPRHLDADGLKIDFLAQTPTGATLRRHGSEWGAALLHRYLKHIHTSALTAKSDALVISHSPNPSFADIGTMSRFNDINDAQPVIPQMIHRHHIAHAALPGHLYDTDNWPMPSIQAWRDYLPVQTALGVPALYYATRVAGEPMSDTDYQALAQAGFTRTTL